MAGWLAILRIIVTRKHLADGGAFLRQERRAGHGISMERGVREPLLCRW